MIGGRTGSNKLFRGCGVKVARGLPKAEVGVRFSAPAPVFIYSDLRIKSREKRQIQNESQNNGDDFQTRLTMYFGRRKCLKREPVFLLFAGQRSLTSSTESDISKPHKAPWINSRRDFAVGVEPWRVSLRLYGMCQPGGACLLLSNGFLPSFLCLFSLG